MKKDMTKFFNIGGIILSVLLIIGLKTFAAPCTGMVKTAKGMEIPMKCHWLAVALIYLSIAVIVISIANMIKKGKTSLEFIGLGILTIAITFDKIGIGKCKVDTMPCNFTKTFTIIIGALLILLGIAQLFIKNEVEL